MIECSCLNFCASVVGVPVKSEGKLHVTTLSQDLKLMKVLARQPNELRLGGPGEKETSEASSRKWCSGGKPRPTQLGNGDRSDRIQIRLQDNLK